VKIFKCNVFAVFFIFGAFLLGNCTNETPSEYYVQILIGGTGKAEIDWGKGNQKSTYEIIDNNLIAGKWCSGSAINTIKISGDNIVYLEVLESGLSALTLNLSGCTALTSLNFRYDFNNKGNKLTTLDVSGCTKLEALYCYGPGLTALDVTGCTALETLYCYDTGLAALDVTGCTVLEELYCSGTGLTALNVNNSAALKQLDCSRNRLTTLDLNDCTALVRLNCAANRLTSLDLCSCTGLSVLDCNGNQLSGPALNALFDTLPVTVSGIVYIYGNPGAGDCIRERATGWRVIY